MWISGKVGSWLKTEILVTLDDMIPAVFRRCHTVVGSSSSWWQKPSIHRLHHLLMMSLLIHLYISSATFVSNYFTRCQHGWITAALEGHAEGSILMLLCERYWQHLQVFAC